ncbi:adenosine receptor A1-like [Hippoglossus hippoglossus]|uniref:adenosine receptor A1-like n=1 Tax=Hippoglossus hippoglossus TaxID=8267 RepID=UPI00148C45C1|nr:adenosine receptor A1-like [Hippoglossus hippoglossus]
MSYMVYFNFFCCLLVPLVAMIIIYAHIFLTVRRQLRRIAVARGTGEDARAGASGSSETGTEDTGSSAAGGREGAGGEPDLGDVRQLEEKKSKAEVKSGTESPIDTETSTVFTKSWFRITSANFGSAPADLRPGESTVPKSNTRTSQELRKATSLFMVLFLFTVCWLPIHLINCILLLCPNCNVPMSLTLTAILLSHANSALNPILYAYRMRSFRHTLIGMWRGVWSAGPKHQ